MLTYIRIKLSQIFASTRRNSLAMKDSNEFESNEVESESINFFTWIYDSFSDKCMDDLWIIDLIIMQKMPLIPSTMIQWNSIESEKEREFIHPQ